MGILIRRGTATVAAMMFLILSPTMHAPPGASTVERYVATAINMGTPGRAGAGTVEMDIEKWSTDEDHDRLRPYSSSKGRTSCSKRCRKCRGRYIGFWEA